MHTRTHETCQLKSVHVPCSGSRAARNVGREDSDIQLVERFQPGDWEVLDKLFLGHRDRIHGIIWCMISNREVASDIMQDVFFKAHKARWEFKNTAQLHFSPPTGGPPVERNRSKRATVHRHSKNSSL